MLCQRQSKQFVKGLTGFRGVWGCSHGKTREGRVFFIILPPGEGASSPLPQFFIYNDFKFFIKS